MKPCRNGDFEPTPEDRFVFDSFGYCPVLEPGHPANTEPEVSELTSGSVEADGVYQDASASPPSG